MPKRNVVVIVVIVVCVGVALAAGLGGRRWGVPSRVVDILEHGQHVQVICINPQCGRQEESYRAHSTNVSWPWTCPACGQETLCRVRPCLYCGRPTASLPPSEGRTWFTCTQCGRRIPLAVNAVDVEAEGRRPARKPATGSAP